MAKKKRRRTRTRPTAARPAATTPAPAGDGEVSTDAVESTAPATQKTTTRAKPAPLPPGGRLSERLRAPSPFPTFRESMGAALRTVLGSPVLLGLPLLLALLFWLAAVALGLQTTPSGLVNVLAIPPFSSQFFDLLVPGEIFGNNGPTLLLALAFTIARSVVWAILAGLILEALEYRAISWVGFLQGLRIFPTVLIVNVLLVAILISVIGILFQLLGPLGLFAFVAAVLGGVHFLVFAPAAALRGYPGLRPAAWKSIRAARLPGSRHIGMVGAYAFLAIGLMAAMPGRAVVTANPTFGAWAFILGATVIHMVFFAAFCHRWLAVEDQVPEPPPPRTRRRR